MKKKLVITLSVILSVLVVAILVVGILFYVIPPTLKVNATVGVKWLENYSEKDTDKYMEFLKQNGVDEIYYKITDFNENMTSTNVTTNDNTMQFIKKANANGLKVYAYWDKAEWLTNQSSFETVYNTFKNYRNTHPDAAFEGIHIAVLPTAIDRTSLKNYLEKLVIFISDKCKADDIKVDFEMPSNIDLKGQSNNVVDQDNLSITIDGTTKVASEWVTDCSDRVFVVSNSNNYKTIKEASAVEFEYAKTQNKTIFYNFETADLTDELKEGDENDGKTYLNFNKRKFYNEIKKAGKDISQDYGCCIGDIQSWYNMKNN